MPRPLPLRTASRTRRGSHRPSARLHTQARHHLHRGHASRGGQHAAQLRRGYTARLHTRHCAKDISAQLQRVLRETLVRLVSRYPSATDIHSRKPRHHIALAYGVRHRRRREVRHRDMRGPLVAPSAQRQPRPRRRRHHLQPLSQRRAHRQARLPASARLAAERTHHIGLCLFKLRIW